MRSLEDNLAAIHHNNHVITKEFVAFFIVQVTVEGEKLNVVTLEINLVTREAINHESFVKVLEVCSRPTLSIAPVVHAMLPHCLSDSLLFFCFEQTSKVLFGFANRHHTSDNLRRIGKRSSRGIEDNIERVNSHGPRP